MTQGIDTSTCARELDTFIIGSESFGRILEEFLDIIGLDEILKSEEPKSIKMSENPPYEHVIAPLENICITRESSIESSRTFTDICGIGKSIEMIPTHIDKFFSLLDPDILTVDELSRDQEDSCVTPIPQVDRMTDCSDIATIEIDLIDGSPDTRDDIILRESRLEVGISDQSTYHCGPYFSFLEGERYLYFLISSLRNHLMDHDARLGSESCHTVIGPGDTGDRVLFRLDRISRLESIAITRIEIDRDRSSNNLRTSLDHREARDDRII